MKLLVEFPEPELFSSAHAFAVFLSSQRFEANVQAVSVGEDGAVALTGPEFAVKAPPTQDFVVVQA